ncbi:hypothetical protein [Gemmatimonas aurantiaca]|uniref:hypothetical protein n=1 Tax=Gemmatimonas aurantiaca TaxID=173480 RepID=UPI00301DD788
MTQNDATTILAIATLAALADGQQDNAEQARIAETAATLGLSDADAIIRSAAAGERSLASLAASLSSREARQAAYDTAAAVCHANGWINPSEAAFLRELASLVGADVGGTEDAIAAVNRLTDDPGARAGQAPRSALDQYILDQAMLTAALEILPDRLANLGILPLQLRLVHHIGQSHGLQQIDAAQIKDLAATLGLGAAAQVLEKAVRRTFGGLAGGLLGAFGGLVGGAAGSVAGLASGAAVTFAATYALGHVADQYYAQGRQLSASDLKALFARFRTDADTIFPRVEARIRELAQGGSLSSVLRSVQ